MLMLRVIYLPAFDVTCDLPSCFDCRAVLAIVECLEVETVSLADVLIVRGANIVYITK